MKIGVFSDIHGNIDYLKSCLERLAEIQVDHLVFLGDAVGYMPFAQEVLELLEQKGAQCLLGNHEAMLCGMIPHSQEKENVYQLEKACHQIPKSKIDNIKFLLPFAKYQADGCNILFLHGSPWDPLQGYLYPDFSCEKFRYPEYEYIFMGHTHRPFITENSQTVFVNVGSCGLPRDIGNQPSFAVLDTIKRDVQLYRILFKNTDRLEQKMLDEGVHKDVVAVLQRR